MRHTRALLFLAAITALLVLLVVFEPGRDASGEKQPLTALEAGAVERLRITRTGQPTLEVQRRGAHWWVTAPWPVAVPALDYRIESALGLLAAPREHSQPLTGLDPAQFELDEPGLVLEVGDERLIFGNTHPITRERHVARGDELHRIVDFHFAAIDVDPADWVATAAIPPDVRLERIELPGRVLALAPPAPGPDGSVDPAASVLAWNGPQAEGELTAQAVAESWREARAWRVEALEHWDPAAAGAHSGVPADSAAPGDTPNATAATAPAEGPPAAPGAGATPGLGALDRPTTTPITGAADVQSGQPLTGAADVQSGQPLTGAADVPGGEAAGSTVEASPAAAGPDDGPQALASVAAGAHIRLGWDGGGVDYRIVQREPELVLARDDAGLAWVFEGPEAKRLLGLVDESAATVDGAGGAEGVFNLPEAAGEHLHAH